MPFYKEDLDHFERMAAPPPEEEENEHRNRSGAGIRGGSSGPGLGAGRGLVRGFNHQHMEAQSMTKRELVASWLEGWAQSESMCGDFLDDADDLLAPIEPEPAPEDINQTHLDLGKAVFNLGSALNRVGVKGW